MSLQLENGTVPHGLNVQFGLKEEGGHIRIGSYELSMEDLLLVARYALTNTDLEDNDPRLDFIEWVGELQERPVGFVGKKRLSVFSPYRDAPSA